MQRNVTNHCLPRSVYIPALRETLLKALVEVLRIFFLWTVLRNVYMRVLVFFATICITRPVLSSRRFDFIYFVCVHFEEQRWGSEWGRGWRDGGSERRGIKRDGRCARLPGNKAVFLFLVERTLYLCCTC